MTTMNHPAAMTQPVPLSVSTPQASPAVGAVSGTPLVLL